MSPFATLRACSAAVVLVAASLWSLPVARAAQPDYKLGDVAREDIVTPVPLQVVNPEATDALKQKVAQQVQFIVRMTPQSSADAEKELRDSLEAARSRFLSALQRALNGRAPAAADVDSPAFASTVRDMAREFPKDLPFDRLAPLWVRGASDELFIESLLQPIREMMAQPIVAEKAESPIPRNQNVRLLPVKNMSQPVTALELEGEGTSVSSGKVVSLWRARRLVETYFPSGQEALGRYASTFVRTNAYADPGLTELVRAKRVEGITANDSYEAAQVIVRKGQIIDRKALSALAVLREKSLIGTLQTKLEQEQIKQTKLEKEQSTIAGQITKQTMWIAAGVGGMFLALVLIFWRLSARPAGELLPVPVDPALAGSEQRALSGGADDDTWRDRAIQAEGKAERAQQAIRSGALGWMRDKLFQSLFSQRAELLSAQQKAEAEMRELEQRLEQLHTPLQERITAYEKRIEELEKELVVKGEENRELIGARINVAKQQLTVERERERGWFATN